MNKIFRMTPDIVPYYGAVLAYGCLLFVLPFIARTVHISYNARAVADEQGVSIDRAGFYNETVLYTDIVEAVVVPVDQESAYYPRGRHNGMDAHDGLVGGVRLANDQICLSLVSRNYADGVYLEDTEGTCYLLAVQNAQALMELIEIGTANGRLSETGYFPRTEGNGLYVFGFLVITLFMIAAATFVFAGVRRYHKPHVRATEQSLSVENVGRSNAEIPYEAITRVGCVPVGPETDYYPTDVAWWHPTYKSKVGRFVLANGRTCTTLFSEDYDEGLFMETVDGACYLLTIEKADQLLDLIERKRAQLSTA